MAARYTGDVREILCSVQCNYLEENFVTCLKEKAVKDDVPEMKCKTEYVEIIKLRFCGSTSNALKDLKTTAIR